MEPSRVSARVSEQYNRCTLLRGLEAFARPLGYGFAIGWIADDNMTSPVLIEAIFAAGEVVAALGILRRRTRIKREAKFLIQLIEK